MKGININQKDELKKLYLTITGIMNKKEKVIKPVKNVDYKYNQGFVFRLAKNMRNMTDEDLDRTKEIIALKAERDVREEKIKKEEEELKMLQDKYVQEQIEKAENDAKMSRKIDELERENQKYLHQTYFKIDDIDIVARFPKSQYSTFALTGGASDLKVVVKNMDRKLNRPINDGDKLTIKESIHDFLENGYKFYKAGKNTADGRLEFKHMPGYNTVKKITGYSFKTDKSTEEFFMDVLTKRIIAVKEKPQKSHKPQKVKKSQSSGSNAGSNAGDKTGDLVALAETPAPVKSLDKLKSDREELHNKFNQRSKDYMDKEFDDESPILKELENLQTDIIKLSQEIGEINGQKPDSKTREEAREIYKDSGNAIEQYGIRIEGHIENGTTGSDEYKEDVQQQKKYTIDAMRAYIDLYLNL